MKYYICYLVDDLVQSEHSHKRRPFRKALHEPQIIPPPLRLVYFELWTKKKLYSQHFTGFLLVNALVHVNIDQGIHKVNSKLYEMKNEKKKNCLHGIWVSLLFLIMTWEKFLFHNRLYNMDMNLLLLKLLPLCHVAFTDKKCDECLQVLF